MNRASFLRRLGIGVVAAPVVVEAMGAPSPLDFLTPGTYVAVLDIPEKANPQWKPYRREIETWIHEDLAEAMGEDVSGCERDGGMILVSRTTL